MDGHSQYLLEVGLDSKTSWQDKVSKVSKDFGVNAVEAAKLLEPYYISVNNARWVLAVFMNPTYANFINQMADLVHKNQIAWSDAVGHVSRQLNLPADKSAVLLSESMKNRY